MVGNIAIKACVLVLIYWLAIAILYNVAFPYDASHDLKVAAQKCYEQNQRALLIDDKITCRRYPSRKGAEK